MIKVAIGIFSLVLFSTSALKAADDKSIHTLNGFIFVVDVSGSMDELTQDGGSLSNRYLVATNTINNAIKTIKTKISAETLYSKIPIVTFSESASIVKVVDTGLQFVDLYESLFRPQAGTNIVAGLDMAIQAAKEQSQQSGESVIWNVILITDGEHTANGDPIRKLKQMKQNSEIITHVSVVTLDFSSRNQESYSKYARLMNAKGASELVSAVQQVIAEAVVASGSNGEGLYDACQMKVKQKSSLDSSELQYTPTYGASQIVDRFVYSQAIAYRATGPESEFSKTAFSSCESKAGQELTNCLYAVCRDQVYGK
jgi:hypothetical protein